MCDPVTMIAVAAGKAAVTGARGFFAVTAQKRAMQAANIQLKQDITNERIRALDEENQMVDNFRMMESTNIAQLGANLQGGENMSYTQGIAKRNTEILVKDITASQFNSNMEVGRLSAQIKANKQGYQSAVRSAVVDTGMAFVESIVSQAGQSMTQKSEMQAQESLMKKKYAMESALERQRVTNQLVSIQSGAAATRAGIDYQEASNRRTIQYQLQSQRNTLYRIPQF